LRNAVLQLNPFTVVRNNHRPTNPKSDADMRKQRDAIKKDLLQRKIDLRWDKDTHDRSRYAHSCVEARVTENASYDSCHFFAVGYALMYNLVVKLVAK
jgi:uncharacterized protein (DUF2252 family)